MRGGKLSLYILITPSNKKKNEQAKRRFGPFSGIGSIITRQEIIKHLETLGIYFYNIHWISQKIYTENKQYVSTHTLDYMCNLVEKVGYLDKTKSAGMYVVNKHFPSDYTVFQLRKDYDRLW